MPALPACWEVITAHWQDYIYNFEAKKKKQLDMMNWLSNIGEERKEKLFKIEISHLLLPDSLKI